MSKLSKSSSKRKRAREERERERALKILVLWGNMQKISRSFIDHCSSRLPASFIKCSLNIHGQEQRLSFYCHSEYIAWHWKLFCMRLWIFYDIIISTKCKNASVFLCDNYEFGAMWIYERGKKVSTNPPKYSNIKFTPFFDFFVS